MECHLINALIYGIPDDQDPEKTGAVLSIFGGKSNMESREFVEAVSAEQAGWIFCPSEIRRRLHLINDYGLENMEMLITPKSSVSEEGTLKQIKD